MYKEFELPVRVVCHLVAFNRTDPKVNMTIFGQIVFVSIEVDHKLGQLGRLFSQVDDNVHKKKISNSTVRYYAYNFKKMYFLG